MNRAQAHALLDAARDGQDISEREISYALFVTDNVRDNWADQPRRIEHHPVGTWELPSAAGLLRAAGPFDGLFA